MAKILKGIWQFFTVLKEATFTILFLILITFLVIGIFSADSVEIPDQAALVIKPSGVIVEQKRPVDPMSELLAPDSQLASETLLRDITEAINAGAEDTRIKSLVLDLSDMQSAGFSKLEEIGKTLEAFKSSGKPIYAYGKRYSQAQYYLASFADEIYLDKNSHQLLGGVFLTGIGVYPTYYKAAIDKLKVKVHVFKVGTFKSAIEPLIRDDMSDAAREANGQWIGELWQHYQQQVTSAREISPEAFANYTNHYDEVLRAAGSNPNQLAVDQKLVDELITAKAWREKMQALVGEGDTKYNYAKIGMSDYLSLTRPPIPLINPTADKVAVITAKGVIYDGVQAPGDIGGDSTSELIRDARLDSTVKAIVFRVDSPGGSASASEQIRTELVAAQAQGKPVVISMGTYAASGGYWVSASANKIFAAETTITGSIGVFATIPSFENSAEYLGFNSDGVGTTDLSDSFNVLKTLNPVLSSTLDQGVKHTYEYFLSIVAEGRDMTTEAVDAVAQGRVWTATTALKLGLIDAIGTESDAIASAALLADLGQYEVLRVEKQLSPKEQLIQEIVNSSVTAIAPIVSSGGAASGIVSELELVKIAKQQLRPLLQLTSGTQGKPGLHAQCLDCAAVF